MNDTEFQIRLKRLRYRANHRGIKEMDIILGGFANCELDNLSNKEIDDFEELLVEHDRDLLLWFTGEAQFPIERLADIFERIRGYSFGKSSDA